jgi:hypothetical protein
MPPELQYFLRTLEAYAHASAGQRDAVSLRLAQVRKETNGDPLEEPILIGLLAAAEATVAICEETLAVATKSDRTQAELDAAIARSSEVMAVNAWKTVRLESVLAREADKLECDWAQFRVHHDGTAAKKRAGSARGTN